MVSPNKIYATYVKPKYPKLPFAKWIAVEKAMYQERQVKIDFVNWLNRRYSVVKDNFANANGWDILSNVFETAEDIAGTGSQVVDAIKPEDEDADTTTDDGAADNSGADDDDKDPPKSTFLGLPTGLAIGLGALVVIGGGIAIYHATKGKKTK